MEKLKMETENIAQENFNKLYEMFPNIFSETVVDGKTVKVVDPKALEREINCEVLDDTKERYAFTWPEKSKYIMNANLPTNNTLRPKREESVDFDNTENLYIKGDNLEVLKILRNNYLGRIKMIYIDPPYNTGNDFVYNDKFTMDTDEYSEESGQIDKEGNRLFKNTESNGRYHTDWLNMIYPRLKFARDLLSDDGVIFISIDDNEVSNLKKVCDEIFGESNFIGTFVVNSTPNARDYGHIGKMHEYCLFYVKDIANTITYLLPDENKSFKYSDNIGGFNIHPLYNSNEAFHNLNRPNLYYPFYLYLDEKIESDFYKIGLEKKENSIEIFPPKSVKNNVQFVWRWGKDKALQNLNKEIIGYKVNDNEYRIVQKMRHSEKLIRSLLLDKQYSSRKGTAEVEDIFNGKVFSFPKPLGLLHDLCKISLDDNDIVLDFFSGSATTAHAVMELNAEDGGKRKFIMVQLPEQCDENSEAFKAGYKNICEIGMERIRRAGKKIKDENPLTTSDLDTGFRVLELDSSNMIDSYFTPDQYEQESMDELSENNIKIDRTEEDVLFSVMNEMGILLSSKIEIETIGGVKVYKVNNNQLYFIFETNVSFDTIKEIAEKKPIDFVMVSPEGAEADSLLSSYEQIFKTYSPNTRLRIL